MDQLQLEPNLITGRLLHLYKAGNKSTEYKEGKRVELKDKKSLKMRGGRKRIKMCLHESAFHPFYPFHLLLPGKNSSVPCLIISFFSRLIFIRSHILRASLSAKNQLFSLQNGISF